jgi:hypothetical protein
MAHNEEDRYRDFVTLRLEADKVLSATDERDLIGDGIAKFKLNAERARGILAAVARLSCQVIEREVARAALNVLRELAGKRGAIDRRRFDQGVVVLKGLAEGQIDDAYARSWLKRIVEQSDLTVRGSGLFRRKRWFRKIRMIA